MENILKADLNGVFRPLSKKEELALLQNDSEDWRNTKLYLDKLIRTALNGFILDDHTSQRLHTELLNDVPIAVQRFLVNKAYEKNYSFATYFTWYIAQRINVLPRLKKRADAT
jgi:hypothetical protein